MANAHSWDKKIFGVVDYSISGDEWDYSLTLEVENTNAPKEKLLEAINLLVEEFKSVYGLEGVVVDDR